MRKLFASIFIIAVIPLIGICADTKNIASLHSINEVTPAENRSLCDAEAMPNDTQRVSVGASASASVVIDRLSYAASKNASGERKTDMGPFCHVVAFFQHSSVHHGNVVINLIR